jgi:6-pyruvoyl-tetrahydropterin synthase
VNNNEYNGHYNYETWLVSLNISDFQQELQDMAADAKSLRDMETSIQNFVNETLLNEVEESKNTFLKDVVNSFLSEVNWQDIAKSNYTEGVAK